MSTRRATAVLPPAERGSARVDCGRSRTQLSRVLLFFVFTYVITWTCFLLAGRLGAGSSGAALPLLLVGSFAPSAVAVVMTWRLEVRVPSAHSSVGYNSGG